MVGWGLPPKITLLLCPGQRQLTHDAKDVLHLLLLVVVLGTGSRGEMEDFIRRE